MKEQIKEKWLAALRSGDYKQGKAALRSKDDEFCCLGVLCDVLDSDAWTENPVTCRPYAPDSCLFWGGMFGALPMDTRDEVEITDDEHNTLVDLNDDGRSFEYIADHIERNM